MHAIQPYVRDLTMTMSCQRAARRQKEHPADAVATVFGGLAREIYVSILGTLDG